MAGLAGLLSFLGVGEISGQVILQLLPNTNDLADGCLNFRHLDNSGHCGRTWLSWAAVYSRLFEFQSP